MRNDDVRKLKNDYGEKWRIVLTTLLPREQLVLEFLCEDKTTTEISNAICCSRGTVSVIKRKALRKLRHPRRMALISKSKEKKLTISSIDCIRSQSIVRCKCGAPARWTVRFSEVDQIIRCCDKCIAAYWPGYGE